MSRIINDGVKMSLFRFKIADSSGNKSEVTVEGDSRGDAVLKLSARGVFPLEFLGQASHLDHAAKQSFFQMDKFDVSAFTNRLVPLLRSHIPLEKALAIISEGDVDPQTRSVVHDIRKGLHEGKKLSELIKSHGNRFPKLYANLVEAGEESGALPQVMIELQRFLNDTRETKNFLVTSSIYPAIILSVTLGVFALLFTVFIPKFAKMFIDMGKELPLLTEIMVSISDITLGLWWLWLAAIIGLIIFGSNVKKGGNAREWWHKKILFVPLIGKIVISMEVCRFIRTLAVLIKNHVHVLDTVRIASRVINNNEIAHSVSGVSAELQSGHALSKTLAKSPFVPKSAIQMLQIGEQSGTPGEMLDEIATQLEDELKLKIKRLLALFEPAMILFMAGVVLVVVMSIFMAIMEMSDF